MQAACEKTDKRFEPTIVSRLADRFVFQPSRFWIAVEDLVVTDVPFGDGHFELWIHLPPASDNGDERDSHLISQVVQEAELFILKFPGTGGRAERSTTHPADWWTDKRCAVFVVNPPGYGGSTGRPSLNTMEAFALAAYDAVARHAEDRPIVLTGNSLGAVSALTVAARRRVNGLLLRNPPPLREVIVGRFGWWNFGFAASLIARQAPMEIDSIANAAKTNAPAVFVSSAKDRIVPLRFQQQVIEEYAGTSKTLRMLEADHGTPINAHEQEEYCDLLNWLLKEIEKHR